MNNDQRIYEAFKETILEDLDDVKAAAEELSDIDPTEVIDWITQNKGNWYESEILWGVKNIEEAFGVKFNFEWLINFFFTDTDNWQYDNCEMIAKFNEITGYSITVDDVTRNIDPQFIISLNQPRIDVAEFSRFIEENYGDKKLLIQKIAPVVDKLSPSDIDFLVTRLALYVNKGDLDMQKLYATIDWNDVKDGAFKEEYIQFFRRLAPEITI